MALDRPVYSTPPPVESTPQNNECRLVDVHGHKIAAFTINHDEYICLPQVSLLSYYDNIHFRYLSIYKALTQVVFCKYSFSTLNLTEISFMRETPLSICHFYFISFKAFDLFLKHLVGGLHTVYTKLKRLSITPLVCNVEQVNTILWIGLMTNEYCRVLNIRGRSTLIECIKVRTLRGLGAIQPGVNRCKLITRRDFEALYQDCTTSR